MAKIFLTPSASKGKFYEKSKEPKEGYEQVTYGTDNKITYHKYHDRVEGVVKGISSRSFTYEGREIYTLEVNVAATNGDDISISMPMNTQSGSYTSLVQGFISSLENYKVGEPVSISVYINEYKTKSGEDRKKDAVYISYINIKNDEGKQQGTGFIPYTEIPPLGSKVVAGKTIWNADDQTEFFYQKLLSISARLSSNSQPAATNSASPAPSNKPAASSKAAPAASITEDDDLPF